jgi:hypothetical protein
MATAYRESLGDFAKTEARAGEVPPCPDLIWARELLGPHLAQSAIELLQCAVHIQKQLRGHYAMLRRETDIARTLGVTRNLLSHFGAVEPDKEVPTSAPGMPFLRPGITILKKKCRDLEIELWHALQRLLLVITERDTGTKIYALSLACYKRLDKLI